VNPLYYVTCTTATLCASFILFKGFNTTSAINTISLLCGFLVIFSGVYLLNFSRTDPHGFTAVDRDIEFPLENGISAAIQGRRSLQGRRSNGDIARRASLSAAAAKRKQEESLLQAFEEDDIELGLNRVSEEEEDSVETLPENNNHHHSPPPSPRS
jgi:magnesium transporter